MIQQLTNQQIDRHRWDAAVQQSAGPSVYAMSWYLDACAPGWQGLIMRDYEAVMPLTLSSKLGITYFAQPHFAQQLGVFGSNVTPGIVQQFLAAIPTKVKLTEICLNSSNYSEPLAANARAMHNYELPLAAAYNTISEGYSSNLRRNLRKAAKSELQISSAGEDVSKAVGLFKAHRPEVAKSLPKSYFATLQTICTELHSRGLLLQLHAHLSNEPAAAAVFAVWQQRAIFLFSGNSATGLTHAALPALIDHAIKHHCNQWKLLDFEGSNDPGLARFYKGFGADLSLYLFYRHNDLPGPVKWLKR